MPIGTQLFLLAQGLSLAGAPYPRERFLAFAVIGGSIGLLTGAPAAMILGAACLLADARATYERREAERHAALLSYRPVFLEAEMPPPGPGWYGW